jgi:protein-S-isoprenylcysteine O-methyltransferase Ste14
MLKALSIFGCLGMVAGVIVKFCEEALVTARYPEYRQYAATTWRMLPYVF